MTVRSHRPEEEAFCAPTPEQEEGPYYRDLRLFRSDIREERPGTPLGLEIRVVDSDCLPVPGVAVDIWQCDALGTYSWYAAAGDDDGPALLAHGTFLRGCQRLAQDGACRFRTIYPGWYSGRAVHIHFKLLHADGTRTGQLYFPEELTDGVHQGDPYRSRPRRDTMNADDVIYRDGGAATLLQPRPEGDGFAVDVTLVIERQPDRESA